MSARDEILRAVREACDATFGGNVLPPLPELPGQGGKASGGSVAARTSAPGSTGALGAARVAPKPRDPGAPRDAGAPGAMGASVQAADAGDALVERFTVAAGAAAAQVEHSTRARVAALVSSWFPPASHLLSAAHDVAGNVAMPDDPHALAALDVFVCEGVLGVAESGAIWLPTSRLGVRAALLLAHDVVVLLPRAAIVGDLHEAYAAVDVSAEAFGVFLAGPSKTADIEQSLVIGAHGARGTRVVLLDD